MNPSEILGIALESFEKGNHSASLIIHSPDFDPDIQPLGYYFRSWEQMPEIEKMALENARGKILDIGAGAGCHSLELQKRGAEVSALELSKKACKLMKKRGIINLINSDIFGMAQSRFDTLLMLMNGIGLVGNISGLQIFLAHAKSWMNPGGQILLDSANLSHIFNESENEELENAFERPYFGEIEFVMEFEGVKSDSFTWLYIDFDSLCFYAEREGYIPELLMEDDNYQYLARLSLPEKSR